MDAEMITEVHYSDTSRKIPNHKISEYKPIDKNATGSKQVHN